MNSVLIFDCDVHQGDGTATILANEPRAFTCSIHCEKNFPQRKAKSDLDVNVPKGASDDEYLNIVQTTLDDVLARVSPDLVIYDAGVDVYSEDPLGLLKVSLEGLRVRDRLVLETLRSAQIPVATVIGGGYDIDQSPPSRNRCRRSTQYNDECFLLRSLFRSRAAKVDWPKY